MPVEHFGAYKNFVTAASSYKDGRAPAATRNSTTLAFMSAKTKAVTSARAETARKIQEVDSEIKEQELAILELKAKLAAMKSRRASKNHTAPVSDPITPIFEKSFSDKAPNKINLDSVMGEVVNIFNKFKPIKEVS